MEEITKSSVSHWIQVERQTSHNLCTQLQRIYTPNLYTNMCNVLGMYMHRINSRDIYYYKKTGALMML